MLISLVKILCFSLLNRCCVFDIDLLFLMNSLWFFKTIYISFIFSRWFILFSSWVASKEFLKFSNLSYFFMTHFFCVFCFFNCLLSNYKFLLFIQQFLSWFLHLIHLWLIQLFFYFILFHKFNISMFSYVFSHFRQFFRKPYYLST